MALRMVGYTGGPLALTGPLLATDGVVGAPSISFASATNYGFYFAGNHIIMALASAVRFDFSAGNLDLTNTTASYSFNQDCFINRDAAADTIAQRRGTNAQILRIYNTYTDASNYERLNIGWASNVMTIAPAAAGSGTVRAVTIGGALTLSGAVTTSSTLVVGTSLQVGTTMGISIAASAATYLLCQGGPQTSGISQTGFFFNASMGNDATNYMRGMQVTMHAQAGTYSTAEVLGLKINTPDLAAAQTISNLYGIYVGAQTINTALALTNAYGLFIEAPSGAATLNVGLHNAGTSTLVGLVTTTAGVTVGTMLTAAQVNVVGNGAPSNGIYLQSANVLGLAASGGASVLISTSSVALQTGIALNLVTAAMAVGATYSSGNGIFVQNASTNNAISTGSQGGATTALFIGNAQITAVSDVRLKTAITPTKIDAMALIHQLDVIDFTWNDPADQAPVNKNSRGRWTGITAQNLINVAPWVVNAPDRTCPYCRAGRVCTLHPEMWQVDLDYLSGLFTKALQQIDIRLTALEDVVLR